MPTTARRFKQPQVVVNATELKSMQQAEPQNRLNDFDKRSDVRLPGMGLKFDWDKLQDIEADCRLIVLNDRQIAWLEDIIGRLTRAEYYKNPDYIAHLWGIDSAHGAWPDIQDFCEEVAVCLMLGCKVSELVGSLNDINTTLKYILATKTNGTVPDHLFDPGNPERFAAKVGLTLDELKEQVTIDYDYNPTDLDVAWPNMASFENVGSNRRMVEEVPSVFIFDGWTSDLSMAQMYAETMYYDVFPKTEWPNGSIPHTQIMTEILERLELAARHIDAKFSRSGRLDLNLPDVPQIRHPITGQRTELSALLGQYGLPLTGPNGAPWPLTAWTKPSVFTAGAPRSDDPLGVLEESFAYDTHLAESVAKGLIADWRPTIRLTQGLAPVMTFPAINVPLPGNLGTITLPPMPLFAGTYDAYVPGESGRGLADLLKQEEEVKINSYVIPGLGTVETKWDRHRFFIKVPNLPTLPAASALPTWLTNMFNVQIGQAFIYGLTPGVWTQVFPYVRTSYQQTVYDATRIKKPGLGQLFKDILQIQVPNPAYKPLDPNDPTTVEASKLPEHIDGKTFAELFWLEGQKESGEFGKDLPPLSFAELFAIKPDDPNYRPLIQSHAQILNFMQIQFAQGLTDLVQAIDDCCANKANNTEIQNVLEAMADNMGCLVLTQQALVKINGGNAPDCLPTTPDTSIPADCSDVAETYDYIIDVLDWLVWGIETIGNSWLADIILTYLTKARWFIAALTAAGLLEPSPAEEVVTIPLALSAVLSYALEVMLDMGVDFARQAVDGLKANRNDIVSLLCDADEETYDDKVDDFTETIKDLFSEVEIQIKVDDLIKKFFKGTPQTPSPVKGSLLKKIL